MGDGVDTCESSSWVLFQSFFVSVVCVCVSLNVDGELAADCLVIATLSV